MKAWMGMNEKQYSSICKDNNDNQWLKIQLNEETNEEAVMKVQLIEARLKDNASSEQ